MKLHVYIPFSLSISSASFYFQPVVLFLQWSRDFICFCPQLDFHLHSSPVYLFHLLLLPFPYPFTKSQNHTRMRLVVTFGTIWSTPCWSRDIQGNVPRSTSRQLLEISKKETPQPLDNLWQCSVTWTAQKCCLMDRENLLCSSFSSLLLHLALWTAEKSLAPASLYPPFSCLIIIINISNFLSVSLTSFFPLLSLISLLSIPPSSFLHFLISDNLDIHSSFFPPSLSCFFPLLLFSSSFLSFWYFLPAEFFFP